MSEPSPKARYAVRVVADTTSTDPSGPVLVLLPGLGSSATVWRDVCRYLELPYIALDPAGFGYDQDPNLYGIAFTDSVRDVVESGIIGGRQVIVVGHSAGFVIALGVANALPPGQVLGIVGVCGLLDALSDVLMHPVVGTLRHPRQAFRFNLLVRGLTRIWPEHVAKCLRRPRHPLTLVYWPMARRPRRLTQAQLDYLIQRDGAPGLRQLIETNRGHDFAWQAWHVQHPVHLIEGLHDPLTTRPQHSEFLSILCERSIMLTGVSLDTGHLLPLEAPREAADQINAFVRRLQPHTPPK